MRAIAVKQSREFQVWFAGVTDRLIRATILARVERLKLDNPGDVRAVGGGVFEMRIHLGAGWRVYYTWRGAELVILLGGGTKGTQSGDIKKAQELAGRILP